MATSNDNTKLGTFSGVFTPNILTIIGIILFLRLGFVVGSVGLAQAVVIIVLAHVISILTSLSVAAIATNLKVKAGGDYYLISRTLGLGFGGSIGVVRFLAQAISVGFYCMGFAEAVAALLPGHGPFFTQAIAAAAVAGLFVLAWLGADWATRFQYVVMALVFVALVIVCLGGMNGWSSQLLTDNLSAPSSSAPFWIAFAIFFPAVTGFTQGLSMSGDLANPAKSIPRGTLSAIGLSFFIYLGMAVILAANLPNATLSTDFGAMKTISAYAPIIDAGVMAATLSSALASFLGGPRVLQALAADRIFPFLGPFAAGKGKANNPRRAVFLTFLIALGTIGLGNLNLVASVVAMFFLISYGLLNYATFYEARATNPSFRPTFRFFDYRLSLLGAIACLGTILAIDLTAGIAAIGIVLAIYQYLRFKAMPSRWADSRRSYHLHQVREHLFAASREPEHPRDWRPNFLVFSDDPRRRERILEFASWAEGGAGLTTVVKMLEGKGANALKIRQEAAETLATEIKNLETNAFPLVVSVSDIQSGIPVIVQSAGVGPARANTAIANWISNTGSSRTSMPSSRYSDNLLTAFRLGCNLLVLDADTKDWDGLARLEPNRRVIDVWWSGDHSAQLMLILAYLMTRDDAWTGARIRIVAEALEGQTTEERISELETMLEDVRIKAEITIANEPGVEGLVRVSGEATVVFVPFRIQGGRFYHPFGGEVVAVLPSLPIAVLTLAAQDIDLSADPEEGTTAEAAAERDQLERAIKRKEKTERAAKKASDAAVKARQRLDDENSAEKDEQTIEALREAMSKAQEEADLSQRKADRAARFLEAVETRSRERDGAT